MNIDEYLQLSRQKTSLLHTENIAGEILQVYEHWGKRWVCSSDHAILSMMQLDRPADPVLPNHIAMLAALLFRDIPKSVLNLGFGAGTFERFFTDRLPDTHMVSVDTSAALARLAQTHFHIREDWSVILQPADEYLESNTQLFDLVLCDIFNGDQHPACLRDISFYSNVKDSLSPDGIMALNLSPATEQELLDMIIIMRCSFTNILLVKLADYGNVVLLAMQHQPVAIEEQRKRAQLLSAQLQLDLGHIPDYLTILAKKDATLIHR